MLRYLILTSKNNQNKYKFFHGNSNNYEYESKNMEKYIHSNLFNMKFIYIVLLLIIIRLQISIINNKGIYIDEKENEDQINQEFISKVKYKKYFNVTVIKNQMHHYKLYNVFKKPQVSIVLINNENNSKNLKLTRDTIRNLTSRNISHSEILLCIDSKEKIAIKYIKNEFKNILKSKLLNLYEINDNKKKEYEDIINKINGIYTIFIDDINSLNITQIESMIKYTYGKIDNYFEFKVSNGINIYLFKTKFLKNLNDEGEEFDSFDILLNKTKSIPLPILNYIPVSLCPDNNFTKLAYVTMTSLLSTKSINTYICFYLIIPSNFENQNMIILDSLHEDYEYFNITYIKMDNRYDNSYTDLRITKQAYYRFSLAELLPNLKKIIYLDTDIIIYKDLLNFYNINFEGKIILGFPTFGNNNRNKFALHSINTGILLLNLIEMRKIKFERKVLYIIKKGKKLAYHDQTLLNNNFKNYIGIFPPEYHSRPWSNYRETKIFNRLIGKVFDDDYFYFAYKYPTMRHFLGRYKPNNRYNNYIEDWWFFARKSKYYNDKADTYHRVFNT